MKYFALAILLSGCASLKPVEQLNSSELCNLFAWRDRGDLKTTHTQEYADRVYKETLSRSLIADRFMSDVSRHRLALGMSKGDVTCSIGIPERIHSLETKHGISEQWVYPGIYIYFRNSKVTEIQD